MFNSIILPYRDRINSLKSFLRSYYISDSPHCELVIVDLNSKKDSVMLIREYEKLCNIKYLRVEYSGIFWKSKALNFAAKESSGEYLTILDVDSVFDCDFLNSIYVFYKNNNFTNKRLSYRVRRLNKKESKYFSGGSFGCNCVRERLINSDQSLFPMAKERFTEKNCEIKELNKSEYKINYLYNYLAIGNSHGTFKKHDYMAIGGHDERFIGHGLEDLDFNIRLFRRINKGKLRRNPQYTIYHIDHSLSPSWKTKSSLDNNRKYYRENYKNNISEIKVLDDWGVFAEKISKNHKEKFHE